MSKIKKMNQKLKLKLKLKLILILILCCLNFLNIPIFSQTPCPTDIGLKDVFVVAQGQVYGICRDYILHEDVTFHFADIFVPGAFISADFGDGNGFVNLLTTQSTINYSSAGEKQIEFRQFFISGNGGSGSTSHYRMKLSSFLKILT
jgi:hypothetical protein